MTKLLTPFSIVKICNIKLIRWTKLKKMANNWMDHSKRPTRRTKKILKNYLEIFLTCGFRGDFRESLNFRFKPSKIINIGLHFRQNLLKVEKWLILALHRKFLNDPDFSRGNRRVRFLPL